MLKQFTHLRFLFCYFLMSLGSLSIGMAQQQTPPCGIDQNQLKKLATDSAYRAFYERVKPLTDKAVVDTTTLITIPVVFVVYHLGEPVGVGSNVSESDLQNQINLMNKMFAGTRPTYGGVDTRIRFTLARRTTTCTPFNGIARVDARSVPNYQSNGVDYSDWQMTNRLRALLPEYQNSAAERYVVVRVVQRITGAGAWASYGGDIVISAPTLQVSSPYNSVLTHEMGHVLFLAHTFEGNSYNSTTGQYVCPPNDSPEYDGDQVADTDPHKIWEPNNSCSASSEQAINSCTGRPFGLIGRNFMSYGCDLKTFTSGQRYRMRSYLADGLRGLTTSVYATAPDPDQQLVPMVCSLSVVSLTTSAGIGITEVQFQGIRKSSRAWTSNDGPYQDYTCQERTTVTAGQSYSLTVRGYGAYRRVYIDYNNNGLFDEATERVWDMGASANSLITIPSTAVTDRYLRMRVVIDNGSSAPTACFLPGSTYDSGEVEDYAVRILPADTPPAVALGTLVSPYLCRGQQLDVPIAINGTFPADNQFYVQLSDATGSFTTPILVGSGARSPISVTLPANATLSEDYRMRVIATNPALVSESSPVLAVENPPSGTLLTGTYSITSGQSVSLVFAVTGRMPVDLVLARNGNSWGTFFGITRPQYTTPIWPGETSVYTLTQVQNGCGPGTGTGSVTVVMPCSAPNSLTENEMTTYSFRANWRLAGGSTVLLQWKEQGATNWNEQSLLNYTAWTISGLSLGKTYVWRIRTVCVDGNSDWSAERTVVLTCPMPLNLYEMLGQTAARLRWWYLGNGVSFTLQWRSIGTTTWTTVNVGNQTYYDLTGLTRDSSYEWRLRSDCSDGSSTNYSASRTFTTQCSYPESSGYGTYSTTEIRVYWSGLPNTRYQVRYRVVGTPTWIESDSTTGLFYTHFRNLALATSYEYQVRAVCSTTELSAYSPAYGFSTQCNQPYVYLATLSLTSAQITWSTMTGQRYDLRWRAVGTPTWTNVQSLTSSPYQLNGLTTGTTYEVQVRGICSELIASGYSNSLTFTPACPVPTNSYMYTSRVGATSAEVVYNIEQGVSYTLQWRPLNTTTWQSGGTMVAGYTSTGFTTSITGLVSNTTYEWRVLSYCANGLVNESFVRQFQTGCFTPYSNGYSTGATSVWVYVGGTTSPVQVRWRLLGTTTWTESTTFSSSSYRITDLTVNATYEWQVRAVCSSTEASGYSSIYQFATQCGNPNTSSLYVTNLLARSATLNFSTNANPTELRWRAVGETDWTTVTSLTASLYSLTGLTTGTTYEWQIRWLCSATVSSNYVSGPTFTPTCPVASNLTEYFVSPRVVQFRWSARAGQTYAVQWRLAGATNWPNSTTYTTSSNGEWYSNLVTGLAAGATYEWRMLTYCDGTPTVSASRTFVTQCTVPIARSYYGLSSRGAGVYWDAPGGVTGVAYRVRYRPVGTVTWTESTTVLGNAVSLTGLSNNTTYEWQVQAICDGTPTDYSPNGPGFTTNCLTPSLYNVSASDMGARLNWNQPSGELADLQYRTSGSATWTTISSLTTGTYSLTGLTPSTFYEWRVTYNCQGGQTNTSSIGTFSTIAGCDPNEPNNTTLTATLIPANATSYSTGPLCLNLTTDNDWFRWDINGQTFYILVYPFAYGTTGPYSLTLSYANNTLKLNTRAVNGVSTDTYLNLYAANGTTLLAQNDDSNGTVLSEITYTLPSSCTAMTTVKAGVWTDPTVWSCNRVPVSTDAVQVLHEVGLPPTSTGRALRITYGAGGKLVMGEGARLVLGQ
jgi:hypothetical protein